MNLICVNLRNLWIINWGSNLQNLRIILSYELAPVVPYLP
jgi:hypothetical protein